MKDLVELQKESSVRKRVSDEFTIKIGEDWRTQSGFICDSRRKGAKFPEPIDDHRMMDWIIGEFQLKHFKIYRLRVTVTFLEEIEK